MHSLNARMLVMSYGGLDKAPLKIQGTVLEKESGSMTDELRKRLRYLEHLPITSVFEVVEIKMQPPLITDETEAFFIGIFFHLFHIYLRFCLYTILIYRVFINGRVSFINLKLQDPTQMIERYNED